MSRWKAYVEAQPWRQRHCLHLSREEADGTWGVVQTLTLKIVEAGQLLYITVYPGKQGVYQKLDIYKADNDLRVQSSSANICRSSKCFEKSVVDYRIMDSWDNNERWDLNENFRDYYVRVYDIYKEKYVRSYFTIERLYKASGVTEHR